MTVCVVALVGRSLFVEGLVSQLTSHSEWAKIVVVDPRAPNCIEKIRSLQPAAVIVDSDDARAPAHLSLEELFDAVPQLKVVRVRPGDMALQVIAGERRELSSVAELLALVRPGKARSSSG